jgi:hypothetical protein
MGDVPQGGGAASPQPGLTALVTDAAGFIDPCGFRTIRERAPPTCGPVSPSSRSGDPVDHALGACVGHAGCAGQCFPRDGSRPTGPIVAFRTEHTSTWVRIPAGAKPSALHGGKRPKAPTIVLVHGAFALADVGEERGDRGARPLLWDCAGSLTSCCLSSPVPGAARTARSRERLADRGLGHGSSRVRCRALRKACPADCPSWRRCL